jgi:hypothetical protein
MVPQCVAAGWQTRTVSSLGGFCVCEDDRKSGAHSHGAAQYFCAAMGRVWESGKGDQLFNKGFRS